MARPFFDFIISGSALFDGAICALVLSAPWRMHAAAPLGVRRWTWAMLAASASFCLKLPFLAILGVNSFGAIRALYIDLAIALPMVALGMVLIRRRGMTRSAIWVCVAAMLPAPLGAYAWLVEPYRLQTERAEVIVRSTGVGKRPVKIGVLADIQTDHVTEHEQTAISRLMAESPDIILLPGDLFQGTAEEFERELPALRGLLLKLSAPGGVYYALGDVDWHREQMRRALEGTAIRVLENEIAEVKVGGWALTIGGIELNYRSAGARETVQKLASIKGPDVTRILVAHRPDVALDLESNSPIDLVVAGHTHGGQIVVPLFGPPITLSNIPRRIAAGGLHVINGNQIYVSRGVGHERGQAPRIRFNCPPEISILTLAGKSE